MYHLPWEQCKFIPKQKEILSQKQKQREIQERKPYHCKKNMQDVNKRKKEREKEKKHQMPEAEGVGGASSPTPPPPVQDTFRETASTSEMACHTVLRHSAGEHMDSGLNPLRLTNSSGLWTLSRGFAWSVCFWTYMLKVSRQLEIIRKQKMYPRVQSLSPSLSIVKHEKQFPVNGMLLTTAATFPYLNSKILQILPSQSNIPEKLLSPSLGKAVTYISRKQLINMLKMLNLFCFESEK